MLQDHLLNSAGNALCTLYTSKTIQNELITICGDLLLNAYDGAEAMAGSSKEMD